MVAHGRAAPQAHPVKWPAGVGRRVLAAVPPTWVWAAIVAIGLGFAVARNLPGPLSGLAP